jgi:hypothetical protein
MRFRGRAACLLGFVIAISQFGCSNNSSRVSAALNENASLTGDIPENPLRWKVITSVVDRSDSTMATLLGNDPAVEYARSHSQQDYPGGSVISLATWTEREDPRWFGANIPDRIKSVEFVRVSAQPNEPPSYSYEEYEGSPLTKATGQDPTAVRERTAYILSLRAAVMP